MQGVCWNICLVNIRNLWRFYTNKEPESEDRQREKWDWEWFWLSWAKGEQMKNWFGVDLFIFWNGLIFGHIVAKFWGFSLKHFIVNQLGITNEIERVFQWSQGLALNCE